MTYFQNINSLAELKKNYRVLALQYHPDKGGSTEAMQQINLEFEKLYTRWKDDTTATNAASGYVNDYAGASAAEYAEYVYNEYRWKGKNYKGQMRGEIVEIVRSWLKDSYPLYQFSVTQNGYRSINIYLIKADFEAFTKESGYIHKEINPYHIEKDTSLTERAREVMRNVYDFVMSYNYDNSDAMTDYFDTNFYLTLGDATTSLTRWNSLNFMRKRSYRRYSRIPREPPIKHCGRLWEKRVLGFYHHPVTIRECSFSEKILTALRVNITFGRKAIPVRNWHKNVSTSWKKPGCGAS